ncbi:MAG: DUF5305 domain-containing protein [Halodesulfurarchaeum sp.]
MSETRWLQIRSAIGSWFWVIAIVLAVLVLVAGATTVQTYQYPGTTTEERVVSSWSTQGSFSHRAEVTRKNPVFAVNTTLTNRSIYYQSVAPVFNASYTFTYTGPPTGSATVDSVVVLQIRAVSEGEENRQVYWNLTTPVARKEVTGIQPGEPVTVRFSRNASAIENRTNAIAEQLGGSPGTIQARFVARTTIDGQVGSQTVRTTEQYALPMSFGENTYSFGDTGQFIQTYERVEQYTVTKTYGPVRKYVAPGVTGIALLGLLVLGWIRLQGSHELSPAEEDELSFRTQREEFEEWITTATLKESTDEDQSANVESLEDLIDLAIDTDERVIEDPSRDQYLVTHEGVTYRYTPPIPIDDVD